MMPYRQPAGFGPAGPYHTIVATTATRKEIIMDFDVIFYNNGDTILQTPRGLYCFAPDATAEAADAALALLDGESDDTWELNPDDQPDTPLKYDAELERIGGYYWLDPHDLAEDSPPQGYFGHNARDFFRHFYSR